VDVFPGKFQGGGRLGREHYLWMNASTQLSRELPNIFKFKLTKRPETNEYMTDASGSCNI